MKGMSKFEFRVILTILKNEKRFKVQVFEKNGENRRVHFVAHYVSDGCNLRETGKKSCLIENSHWNKANFSNVGKIVIKWFMHQVFVFKAVSCKNDTVFWHSKKIPDGMRYTIYDCGNLAISANLKLYNDYPLDQIMEFKN